MEIDALLYKPPRVESDDPNIAAPGCGRWRCCLPLGKATMQLICYCQPPLLLLLLWRRHGCSWYRSSQALLPALPAPAAGRAAA